MPFNSKVIGVLMSILECYGCTHRNTIRPSLHDFTVTNLILLSDCLLLFDPLKAWSFKSIFVPMIIFRVFRTLLIYFINSVLSFF